MHELLWSLVLWTVSSGTFGIWLKLSTDGIMKGQKTSDQGWEKSHVFLWANIFLHRTNATVMSANKKHIDLLTYTIISSGHLELQKPISVLNKIDYLLFLFLVLLWMIH